MHHFKSKTPKIFWGGLTASSPDPAPGTGEREGDTTPIVGRSC